MKNAIRNFFPYAVTLALWYLSGPRFNPFGILALIPVFYYMFSHHIKYGFPFGLLICFLVDYSAGTLFLFSSVFLISNALNSFYGLFENEGNGFNIKKFNLFLLVMSIFMLVDAVFNSSHFWRFLIGIAWLYLWLLILYLPFVALFRRVGNDR